MDGVWVVLLVLVGGLILMGVIKRAPRDDQRRIPYKPTRGDPALPEAQAPPEWTPPARPKADIFDLRRPTPIRILYTDAQGDESEREVTVKSYTVQGGPQGAPSHLRGQCHLREASRAFTLRRVEEAFDMRDGSEIADIAAWLLEQPSRRRPRDLDL